MWNRVIKLASTHVDLFQTLQRQDSRTHTNTGNLNVHKPNELELALYPIILSNANRPAFQQLLTNNRDPIPSRRENNDSPQSADL